MFYCWRSWDRAGEGPAQAVLSPWRRLGIPGDNWLEGPHALGGCCGRAPTNSLAGAREEEGLLASVERSEPWQEQAAARPHLPRPHEAVTWCFLCDVTRKPPAGFFHSCESERACFCTPRSPSHIK